MVNASFQLLRHQTTNWKHNSKEYWYNIIQKWNICNWFCWITAI